MASSTTTSKFLSLVLRHQPDLIGITLDPAGWTAVDALIAACTKHGQPLTRALLGKLVAESDKQRFALSPDGTQIRANQGHSVEVELALPPRMPPAMLFHGTYAGAVDLIKQGGLLKGERHHVHLSPDEVTAKKVGARRGVPVLLRVRSGEMAAAGHVFFCSTNGVWLVESVPAAFIEFPK